ncbi:MAG: hypothetical protein OSJ45_05845 [Lachnospiraceae bacterium]|nr:hypothetical protein [Lachnospiraceae bacterium]
MCNNVKIDKERLERLSDEDKAKYMAIGTAINIKGIEEKYGIEAVHGMLWNCQQVYINNLYYIYSL